MVYLKFDPTSMESKKKYAECKSEVAQLKKLMSSSLWWAVFFVFHLKNFFLPTLSQLGITGLSTLSQCLVCLS